MSKIKLGDYVKCFITGFHGIITGRCEYLHNDSRALVEPRQEEGAVVDMQPRWIEEARLEVLPQEGANDEA